MSRPGGWSVMERNAAVLLVSSGVTSLLGFTYWFVAERGFATADVGRASTVVSAATMLGTLAGLSLGGMYERFLPASGRRARSAIAAGIVLVAVTALALGAAFALLDPTPVMFGDGLERAAFPLVVVAVAVFALADPVAVGLREPRAVAVKNVGFSVAKLAVLVPLAGGGAAAIYGSWAVLALTATLPLLLWALTRGTRELVGRAHDLPPRRTLVSHHRAVFALMVVGAVTPLCLPLIVLGALGPLSAAHFNVAQVIVVATSMLIAAAGSSFIAEAARPGSDRRRAVSQLARMLVLLAGAGTIGLALVGPLLLAVVGPGYAAESAPYLRLAGLALLPQTFVGAYALLCRLESRLGWLVAVQVVGVTGIVGGSALLVGPFGVTGVGVAVLATEVVCAALVAIPARDALRRLRARPVAPAPAEVTV